MFSDRMRHFLLRGQAGAFDDEPMCGEPVGGRKHEHTIASARRDDCGVYLIPPVAWTDPKSDSTYEDPGAKEFIAEYWRHFFAQALEAWESDPATWPKERTLVMFQHWFEVEVREMVLDLGNYTDAGG